MFEGEGFGLNHKSFSHIVYAGPYTGSVCESNHLTPVDLELWYDYRLWYAKGYIIIW